MDNKFTSILLLLITITQILVVAQHTSKHQASETTEQLAEIRRQLATSEERILQSCTESAENLEVDLLDRLNVIEQKLNNLNLDSIVSEMKSYMDQKIETPEINDYLVVYTAKSWPNARDDCLSRGMDLASINSLAEREHILKMMTPNSCGSFWVGAKKSEEGIWEWVNDSTPIHPEIWRWNQPNGNSNYGAIHKGNNMLLNDADELNFCYICE